MFFGLTNIFMFFFFFAFHIPTQIGADKFCRPHLAISVAMAALFHVSCAEKSFSVFFTLQTPAWIGAD